MTSYSQLKSELISDTVSTIEQVSDISLLTASGNSIGDQRVVGNNLYIWNGSGWFRIALINETPTWDSGGQPLSSYDLSADSPQTATTITLAATDPDGFPINYSYVTGGSMDSIGTISQDSSVFTITPKTEAQAPDGGTGSITFKATDGVNILPYVSSFTLNFISTIENSKHTTLLATATSTSDNNNITDSSTNNHSITVNGDAHAGTFSPYRSGGYSTYFDGTGDHIHFVDNSLAEGTDDFTLECWFYLTANLQQNHTIFGHGTTPGYQICANAVNQINFMRDGSNRLLTTATLNLNQWYHIVYQRASGTLYGFLNGVSLGTTSLTDNFTNTGIEVGVNRGGTEYFEGYIRDVRIVKGTTIYNTSETTFTPPTEGLVAVSGSGYSTTLLTCHKPYIADGGANSISPTIYDDVCIKPFSPYDYEEYSTTDHGGSVYFDGVSDYILGNSGTALGTSNWTIQGWMYVTNANNDRMFMDFRPFSNGNYVTLKYDTLSSLHGKMHFSVNNSDVIVSNDFIRQNQWAHIALVKDSGTIKMYINGNVQTQTSSSFSTVNFLSHSARPAIGINGDNASTDKMRGYLSDVKVTIGTAEYTANFTPPTSPVSSSNAELHIKGTDASIIDKSQGANLKLEGTTTGSTTQVKFSGSKSMYFAGSLHDKVIAYAARDVDIPDNGEYTFEAWCYFNSVSGVIHMLSSPDVTNRIAFEVRNSKLGMIVGGSVIQSGSQVLNTGQWYHLAISRVTGSPYSTTRCFVNGNLDQTSTTYQQSPAISGFNEWIIGSPSPNNIGNAYNEVTGYMQDVRFTEGLGRYTANFTPPTASLEG